MEIHATESGRLLYVDIAKGIAMICIILGHLGNSSINRVVFTFHVPIFFFITGYFINSNRDLKEFIKNKARTLLIPYFITCLVIVIIGTLEGVILGDAASALKKWSYAALYGAGDSYTEPFYIPGIGAIWFLLATFWGSILLRLSLKFNKYIRIFFINAVFLAGYFSRNIFWFPLSIQAGACSTLFMYMGYLLHSMKWKIGELPKEVKSFGIVFAAVTWLYFIKDFQSFWLVHCDIGRGIVDIFGCVCACIIVMLISEFIEINMKAIGNFLAYFGKYSLLILCVHLVELNLFPWWQIANCFVEIGMPECLQLPMIISGKLIADFGCVYILSKISFVKKVFGFRT